MNIEKTNQFLFEFRDLLIKINNGEGDTEMCSHINQMKPMIREIMQKANTEKSIILGPPPAIGGQPYRTDPLDVLFDAPWGMSFDVRSKVIAIVDETIGVLSMHPEKLVEETSSTTDFWSIMHPTILQVSKSRFCSGWYADAVEAAYKEVNAQVKKLYVSYNKEELDGAKLMLNAFKKDNPIIRLTDLQSQSDKDVQDGYMHMFAGAMLGIRNPKAHANENISKEDALRKLAFASMLMFKLDDHIS